MDEITLLLVDDEQPFREAALPVLRRRGFRVREADSGEAALASLDEAVPDCVVLDLKMEGMDGLETLRRLREHHPDLPVVILTGHGGFDDALQGMRLDILDFVQKPVDIGLLAVRVRDLLRRGTTGALQEPTIEQLMIPEENYPRVKTTAPLREALQTLRATLYPRLLVDALEPGHRSVLVYTPEGVFEGILRPQDLLRQLIPEYLQYSPYTTYFSGMFLAQAKVVGNVSVGEVIRRGRRLGEQPFVSPSQTLMAAIDLMVSRHLVNLPVVRSGVLLGVLRDKDVLHEVSRSGLGLQ